MRGSDVIVVHGAVAIVIDAVAGWVARRRRPRGALLLHGTRDAGGLPHGRTGPGTAGNGHGLVAFIDRTVTVVIHAVAGHVAWRRRTRNARVHDAPRNTLRLSYRLASAHATGCRQLDVVFIAAAVAVVIQAIAQRVRCCRRSQRSTTVFHLTLDAAGRSDRRTHARAAGGGEYLVLFILTSVAVVVHTVAARIRGGQGDAGHTTIDYHTRLAASRAFRCASAYPTIGHQTDVVIVDEPVAIVVDPITGKIARCAAVQSHARTQEHVPRYNPALELRASDQAHGGVGNMKVRSNVRTGVSMEGRGSCARSAVAPILT